MIMKSRVREPSTKMQNAHTRKTVYTFFVVFYNWSTKKTEPNKWFFFQNRTRGFSQNRTKLEKSIPHISITNIMWLIAGSAAQLSDSLFPVAPRCSNWQASTSRVLTLIQQQQKFPRLFRDLQGSFSVTVRCRGTMNLFSYTIISIE